MAPLATTLPVTTEETEAIAVTEDAADLRGDPIATPGMRMPMRRAATIGIVRGRTDTEEEEAVVTVATGIGIATVVLDETTVVMKAAGLLDATATCLMTDAAATDGTEVATVKPATATMTFSLRTAEAAARLPRLRRESLLPI